MQPGLLARIDDTERLRGATGQVLAQEEDPQLQAIVREAAQLTSAPMALVSLVLRHQLQFRAQVGLTGDLLLTRASARATAFCDEVVSRNEGVIFRDARDDPHAPREPVERYGIRAYAGVPLVVGGHPLGSLCVLDTVPRDFDEVTLQRLSALAQRAQARLEELARLPRAGTEQLFAPALAQARNQSAAVRLQSDLAQQLLVELQPLHRLLQASGSLSDAELAKGVRTLWQSAESLRELRELVDDLATSGQQLAAVVTALGDTLLGHRGTAELGPVARAAATLCSDLARVYGRLHLAPHDPALPLAQPYSDAVLLLGRAFADALSRGPGGAYARFSVYPREVEVEVVTGGGGPAVRVSLARASGGPPAPAEGRGAEEQGS